MVSSLYVVLGALMVIKLALHVVPYLRHYRAAFGSRSARGDAHSRQRGRNHPADATAGDDGDERRRYLDGALIFFAGRGYCMRRGCAAARLPSVNMA